MESNEMDENKIGAHVLYELLVYKEWVFEREKERKISKNSLLFTKPPRNFWMSLLWSIFNKVPWPEEDLAKAASLLLSWQISVSPNGKLVAILEESVLELRQSKDEYTTIIGRASVPKDDRPQLRKIAWSPESNMVAIASSDGCVRIYDCCGGSLIFKIPLLSSENTPKKLISGLEFITARERKGEWELLIIYASGTVECYNISSFVKCSLNHISVLSETGISCTSFSKRYGILFAAVKPINLLRIECKIFSTGITAWRLLNEAPYYKRVFPTDDELSNTRRHGKVQKIFFSFLSYSDCICKIKMAPSNKYLATLNASGIVYIWFAPSLRFHSTLDKFDFKKQKVLVPLSETGICSHVIDIEWRKDSKLIVAWKNGTVSIHDVNTYVVLTYFGPDFLHSLPRLASATTVHGFLALECETDNVQHPSLQYLSSLSHSGSENDLSFNDNRLKSEDSSSDEEITLLDKTSELFYCTMYMITDLERYEPKRKSVKFVQKTFRLLGVKMTTPEELFERYLKNEEFDRAFEICQEYGLDINKVYKRQWRTSEVNEHSIKEYLANIEDDEWVLKECLECVPETLSGAIQLIEFGLNFTNINSILQAESSSELSEKQKLFITSRLQLLNYSHKLQTYELIFDDSSYSVKHFAKFRNQSIVNSAIDFARSGQTEAVELLMTYHGKEVLPFWLNILDNFPETLKPSFYRKILPECDGDKVLVEWVCVESQRTIDWAEEEYASQFFDLSPIEKKRTFKEIYSFDSISLSAWYKTRAKTLEKYTKMVENAIELLELGTKRNIQDLEELLYELKMLSTLVYDLNINIKFSLFIKKDLFEKLKMYMKEPKCFCEITLKWVHPYLEHYAFKNTPEWLSLYREFLIFYSRRFFKYVLEYIEHILQGNLHIIGSPGTFVNVLVDCVYAYEEFDQLDMTSAIMNDTIKWLSSLSEEVRKEELLDKLFSILNEIKGAKILIKYECKRPLSTIHKIKSDVQESQHFLLKFTRICSQSFGQRICHWIQFLPDLIDLQNYCFKSLSVQYCYQIYVGQMLCSGHTEVMAYTPNILCCSKFYREDRLSFDLSIQIVIGAAEYYFNSSVNADDNSMTLAKMCLLLIKDDHPIIQEELDLICAVKLLYDMGIRILPIQVRQTDNKMKLIDLCFDKVKDIYKLPHLMYKLGSKLRIFNPRIVGSEGCITSKLAEEAFKKKEYKWCAEYCSDIMKYRCVEGWKICIKLAECDDFKDILLKKRAIKFAMLHAPSRMLSHIMKLRRKTSIQDLCLSMQQMIVMDFSPEFYQSAELRQFIDKLENILKIPDSQEMVHELHNLWRTRYLQSHISLESPRELFFVGQSFNSAIPSNYSFTSLMQESYADDHKLLWLINDILKLILNSIDETMNDYELLSDVLVACSILAASTDSTLSLNYLLCLKDPKKSKEFFTFFKESSFLYQYQLYYLGLQSQCSIHPSFFNSPFEVVSLFLKSEDDEESLNLSQKIIVDFKIFIEASQVISLQKGIDIQRFKIDEKYKNDTIFGLALNEDKDSLSLAIELAEKNHIPIYEVVISHLISLLINSVHTSVLGILTDPKIINILKENEENCLKRFIGTLPILSGTNYQQLLSFFNIIKLLKNDYIIYDLSPKEHISLLKKIKSLAKEIDYKCLVSGDGKLNDLLRPMMNEDNIFLIAKFLKSLPNPVRAKHHTSMFFSHWGIEEFYNKCINVTFRQCIRNFESLHKYFSRCSEEELKFFVNNTLFSQEASLNIDSGLRKQLISLLINWCESNSYRGPALTIVKGVSLTADNYEQAWKLLNENYNDKRRLASNYLQVLLNFAPFRSRPTSASLKYLLTTVIEGIESFRHLKINNADDFILLYLLLRCLDPATKRAFEKEVSNVEFPALDDLIDFLKIEWKTLDLSSEEGQEQSTHNAKYGNSANRNKNFNASLLVENDKSSSFSKHIHTKVSSGTHSFVKYSCPVCKTAHSLYQCDRFKASPANEKRASLRNWNGCSNCLSGKHTTDICTSTRRCQTCNMKHHTWLHIPVSPEITTSAGPNQQMALSGTSYSSGAILATALIEIKDSRGYFQTIRAVMDPGSQLSFITKDCVDRLGYSFVPNVSSALGIGQVPVSNSYGHITCTLRSRYEKDEFGAHATVIKNIAGDLPQATLPSQLCIQYNAYELADPTYWKPQRIDFLLATDIYYDLITGGPIDFGADYPKLVPSKLGYLVAGRCRIPPNTAKSVSLLVQDTSLEEALCLQQELIDLMKLGGFELSKWKSNCHEILHRAQDHNEEKNLSLVKNEDDASHKILGLEWNSSADVFTFKVHKPTSPPTKRGILSAIARIYDPLGFLAPVVFKAKTLLQDVWKAKCDWDEMVPPNIASCWSSFANELDTLSEVLIPRHVCLQNPISYCIVGYSDASQRGYSANIYLRVSYTDACKVHLLKAKTKLAPTKLVSIPRLELCGAVLLVRLFNSCQTIIHKLNVQEVHFFTDSTVVLGWLNLPTNKLKAFVAHRVTEILESTQVSQWHHVPTEFNPADGASRGLMPNELKGHTMWWTGPDWLSNSTSEWFNSSLPDLSFVLPETKPNNDIVLLVQGAEDLPCLLQWMSRSSSYLKLIRSLCYALRFVKVTRKQGNFTSIISLKEINEANIVCIKIIQHFYFTSDKQVCQSKYWKSLAPFRDSRGLFRVGGRLQHSNLAYSVKHPIILPNCHFTRLLVDYYHKINLHIGPSSLQAMIQARYHLCSGRKLIRSRIRHCVKCQITTSRPQPPYMGDLPACRLQEGQIFQNVGIDLGGPFPLKESHRRKAALGKAYLCLFICMVTKAVHLEVVSSCSTEAFIVALNRFISRRGKPLHIYSDCGTNFVGAASALKDLKKWYMSKGTQNQIYNYNAEQQIQWHFNPPRSPHFGGIWEAGIKSSKALLARNMSNTPLTFEELSTLFSRIEAVLNSRPLCPMNALEESIECLTPGHFLIGRPITSLPEQSVMNCKENTLRRWQLIQHRVQHFWSRWRLDYLNQLQQRRKWTTHRSNMKEGDIVIIKDTDSPPTLWPLARVRDTHPGQDGIVRVVTIQTPKGVYKRPVVKLVPLNLPNYNL